MLTIETGEHSSQARLLIDGVDVTQSLAVVRLEVEPIEPNQPVQVRLTVRPDRLVLSALPEWVHVKLVEEPAEGWMAKEGPPGTVR
jgi:hypothetical protein